MYAVQFTPRGERDFKGLSKEFQKRIYKKLQDNACLDNPLIRAEPLINLPPSTHRFRIGNHRASFYIEGSTIFIERIEIRENAYRRR
jgi:mRNA-degrading endonuclease RelE of RelBE toxin-antitoxin system